MKRLLFTAVFYSTLVFADINKDDLVIVANMDGDKLNLQKGEVINLFMGGANELNLYPVSLKPNSQPRVIFNTKVIGLTESRIQSYWSQMRFSGRAKPPREFESVDELLVYLAENKGAVGYMPSSIPVPEHLTVVYATSN